MVSVSLLQRLERDDVAGGSGSTVNDDTAIMNSVLSNLRSLLNSRRNCCETRPDYGLQDFNATEDYRSSIPLIARDVERQIRLFEPRIRNVIVRAVEDKTQLSQLIFHINGELAHSDRTVRISFDSVLGSDGYMRLNG
ncbi:type VI secretion system baseplate subunit TssE [Rhizobium mayense]|uniref:Type VI secretion system baseplate subunit TssE n=1 Tax=Rhizobium mayense TaxID=1312184 RepID=A0ABT7JSD8_9HYPH|nr:type VI secretion system baseplate subunit TssE [Rhizobium mayense]MDL2398822.1 type VI secretion system baseplate subunit TssE [Rhizobium mayense]